MAVDGRKLRDVPLPVALDMKYRAGREEYGPTWQGDPPLDACFEELLDSLIYLKLELGPTGIVEGDQELRRRIEGIYEIVARAAIETRDVLDEIGEQRSPPFKIPEGGILVGG